MVAIEVIYLLGLFALATYYIVTPGSWLHTFLPQEPGWLPAGVPWFGALGAVIISLSGTFDHRLDWDPSWNLWHFTRPLIGVSLAIISWLILQAGILAVGSGPAGQLSTGSGIAAPTNLLFYLIAFVVGYREEVFRELIKRVADVILTPAQRPSGSAPTIGTIHPPKGTADGGQTVLINGSGLSQTVGVAFGDHLATKLQINSDDQIVAITPPGAAGSVDVTVSTKTGTANGAFTYES